MEIEKENIVENGYRLFGCGECGDIDLDQCCEYHLAVADSIEKAHEILSKKCYNKWKSDVYYDKKYAQFDKDGKPLNCSARWILEYKEQGFFDMSDEEQFHYYTANVFPIDNVTDLKTNIWCGEWE